MTKINVVEQFEFEFQKAFANGDDAGVYNSIRVCCSNILKKLLTGYQKRDDFDEIVDEATLKCFNCLKNHLKKDKDFKVEKLVNFCWLQTYFTLKNPKRAFTDKQVSYEEMIESLGERAALVEKEVDAEEKQIKEDWIELLKYKMAEALASGEAELKLSHFFDLEDVSTMTIFDIEKNDDMITIKRRF